MKKLIILAIFCLILSGQSNLLAMQQEEMGKGLIDAAERGSIAGVREFLNMGTDPNIRYDGGYSPLVHSINNKNIEMVRLFLEAGADPNAGVPGRWTAIMHAAQKGLVDIVELLLDNGAYPHIKNSFGFTALDYAVLRGHINVITSILNRPFDEEVEVPVYWTWNSRNNSLFYARSFSNFFKSRELTDINLPHDIKANRTILMARIGERTFDRLREALARMSKKKAEDFLLWIYTGHIKRGELKLVINTCNYIGIDLVSFVSKSGLSGFENDMKTLYNSRKVSGDFTIIVSRNKLLGFNIFPPAEIRVHKAILSARSNMFRYLFLGSNDTSNQLIDRESGLSLPAMHALIEFIYTGKISYLGRKIANELLSSDAGEFFQLPEGELEEYLEVFILDN